MKNLTIILVVILVVLCGCAKKDNPVSPTSVDTIKQSTEYPNNPMPLDTGNYWKYIETDYTVDGIWSASISHIVTLQPYYLKFWWVIYDQLGNNTIDQISSINVFQVLLDGKETNSYYNLIDQSNNYNGTLYLDNKRASDVFAVTCNLSQGSIQYGYKYDTTYAIRNSVVWQSYICDIYSYINNKSMTLRAYSKGYGLIHSEQDTLINNQWQFLVTMDITSAHLN